MTGCDLLQSQDTLYAIPSVTRVFSKSRKMYVYLQAYEQGTPNIQPLVAYVSLYRAQRKAFETPPLEVTAGLNKRLKTLPLSFSLAISFLRASVTAKSPCWTQPNRMGRFGGLRSCLCRNHPGPVAFVPLHSTRCNGGFKPPPRPSVDAQTRRYDATG